MIERKFAVVFRAPPGVGKSTLIDRLLQRFGTDHCARRSLDKGWGFGPEDFQLDPQTRYGTLKDEEARNKDVLFIELGFGEIRIPLRLSNGDAHYFLDARPGATRNPAEWVRILKAQGRVVHSFLLWAEWDDVKRRILADTKPRDLEDHKITYLIYGRPEFSGDFARSAGIREDRIDVTAVGRDEVESTLLQRLSELGLTLPLPEKNEPVPGPASDSSSKGRAPPIS